MGRIGWGAKAVIYALIGGLACENAVGDRGQSASPEASFSAAVGLNLIAFTRSLMDCQILPSGAMDNARTAMLFRSSAICSMSIER